MYQFIESSETDPLVIDLNGDGVSLIGLGASNAYFDTNPAGPGISLNWR